jgi:glycosyltransferase involved in cell wall biosynthesis
LHILNPFEKDAVVSKRKPQREIVVTLYDLIPLIFEDSYLNSEIEKKRYYERLRIVMSADMILSLSEATRKDAINLLNIRPDKVMTIGGGVSDDFHRIKYLDVNVVERVRRKYSIDGGFIFYVGGIDFRKNVGGLIRAFSNLPPDLLKTYSLVIACSAPQDALSGLKELSKELGIDKKVIFLSYITDEDLNILYNICSLFVLPSLYEGFGLAVLEAMKCGAPVIASNCSSVPEIAGRRDILFDPRHPNSITGLMVKVLGNRNYQEDLRNYGIERAKEFSWERVARRTMESYEQFLKDGKKKTIQIEGPFETSYSLAIVNRNLALSMEETGKFDVSIFATEGPGDYDPLEKDLIDKPRAKELWLKGNKQPKDFIIRNLYPPRVRDVNGAHNFSYFFWEDSLIHKEVADAFNKYLSGILAPSTYVKEVLRNSGVRVPIEVVGVGVDETQFSGNVPPYKIKTNKTFKFLYISSGFPRKGVDVLLKAYFEEFSAQDDCCLVVKTVPNIHNIVTKQIRNQIKRYPTHPEVIHIHEDIDQSEIAGLYKIGDCFVAPTRAEGFGLPIAEAMLNRIPVIATNYSGHKDFCTEENAILIGYRLKPSKSHLKVSNAVWAEPDIDELKQKMRYVYENTGSKQLLTMAEKAYSAIKENYSWDKVTQRIILFFESVEKTIRLGVVTTWNIKCGVAAYTKYLLTNVMDETIQVKIFSNGDCEPVIKDEDNVVRCWNRVSGEANIDNLYREIIARGIHVVNIQYNFGFFGLKQLGDLIIFLKRKNIKIIVTFHSTSPSEIQSLQSIAVELRCVDAILVHSRNDVERLKGYGVIENVILFPHGILVFDELDNDTLRKKIGINNSKIIATFGFLLPHKGVLEVIESLPRLIDQHPDILYLVISSIYPDCPPSYGYLEQCEDKVRELNLENHVKFITDYLEEKAIANLLHLADMIILPYKDTKESSSAAVRIALGAKRSIITTLNPIFDDVKDEVYQIERCDPRNISDAISRLYEDKGLYAKLLKRAIEKSEKETWEIVSKKYADIVWKCYSNDRCGEFKWINLIDNISQDLIEMGFNDRFDVINVVANEIYQTYVAEK